MRMRTSVRMAHTQGIRARVTVAELRRIPPPRCPVAGARTAVSLVFVGEFGLDC
jgi:hypothetical protein